MPNNTTARVIRPVLREAGLEGRIEQITTGRHYTYVRLAWGTDENRAVAMNAVLAALRPLWNDGEQRVTMVYSGMIAIKRAGWYSTEPAAAAGDLPRLLRIVAEGREEYAAHIGENEHHPVLQAQRDVLLAEAAAYRSAAQLAAGSMDGLTGLLPSWRFTSEVKELARRVVADATA